MAFESPEMRQAYINYLTAEGHFTRDEAEKEADAFGGPAKKQTTPTGGGPIMPPQPAEVQKTLKESTDERAKQEGMTFGEKVGLGAGLGLLLGAGGLLLKNKGEKSSGIKDRTFKPGQAPSMGERIEPQMDVNQQKPREPFLETEKAVPASTGSWQDLLTSEEKEMLARSEAAKASKAEDAARRAAAAPPAPPPEPPAFIRNQPSAPVVTDPRIPALLQPPAGAAPPPVATAPVPPAADKPAPPPPAPAPVVTTTVVETPVTEAPPKKEPKAAKAKIDMPQGWGKGMSWLTHQYGVEGAQSFIDQYNKGKPYGTYDEMMKAYTENTTRPKYSDIPKGVRQERGITSRSGTMAIPPPTLRPTDLGQGGSLLRSLTDQLQLKQ